MSLFQIRDTWNYKPVEEEECGIGCLAVGNVDNAADGKAKIICGGYNGLLHIYLPTRKHSGGVSDADDVLLEINLQAPILQLACGNFVSSTAGTHLAVLHPRLLVVYKVTLTTSCSSSGEADGGKQGRVEVVYQHKLERTAASMTWGGFGGGGSDRHLICVESMDGAVSLYEHETFMFARFLPNFLLPSPLVYSSFTDSFITVSSANCLQSYSYQALAVASMEAKTDGDKGRGERSVASTSGGKRLAADWSLNIGESAIDLAVVRQESNKPAIVVLGERQLLCVETSGKLRFMHKFHCSVACMKAMEVSPQSGVRTVVATHSKQLLIFSDSKLQWAAQLFTVPICIEIATIKETEGTLVLMSDKCEVSCAHLGTTPSLFTIPRSLNRAATVEDMEHEISRYRQLIKQAQTDPRYQAGGGNESEEKFPIDVHIRVSNTGGVGQSSIHHKKEQMMDNEEVSRNVIACEVRLRSNRSVEDVHITLQCPPGIQSSTKQILIPSLAQTSGVSSIVRTSFQLDGKCLPSRLQVDMSICFNHNDGSPRVALHKIDLPFSTVVRPCAVHNKKLDHKITIETDLPCADLTQLFTDLLCDESNANSVGFQYIHGPKANIFTSKSNRKYRLECEEYVGLWLLAWSFVKALRNKLGGKVKMWSKDRPACQHLYQLIDRHIEVRKARSEVCVLLEHRSHQFRSIQRRLLARFADKTPQPLNCLDSLLEGTHEQLMTLMEAYGDYDKLLVRIGANLTSCCHLLVLQTALLCGWNNNDDEDADVLNSVLWSCFSNMPNNALSWEECVMNCLGHLLRTKNHKPQQQAVQQLDPAKLKKNLTILLERLCKGEVLWPRKPLVHSTGGSNKISNKESFEDDGF